MIEPNGGSTIGDVLAARGVEYLFTLCGGHISPILVGAKARGIRVVDVRDEKNAVFAADAVARMTGVPGVAAVTAGPGVTNTITAVKNAQMAQSPVLVFGGATATLLKGRGSLQDIDQISLMKPITKWATSCSTVSSLKPTVERALDIATGGVPGPVFVEVPVDLLYPESMVREIFMKEAGIKDADNLGAKALELVIKGYLLRQFKQPHINLELPFDTHNEATPTLNPKQVSEVADMVASAERPVLVIGSQTLVNYRQPERLARAVEALGLPTYLGGMARGLLGQKSSIQFRHKRSAALKKADLVIVCGFPFDFRLGYGRAIGGKAKVVAANLNPVELRKNKRPEVPVLAHAGEFLEALSQRVTSAGGGQSERWGKWFGELREREEKRDAEIVEQGKAPSELVNPLDFFLKLEQKMDDDAILVVDGGDFVATCSYIVRPRMPLRWLDPGAFGTLGVGGGFAVGAKAVHPKSEVWMIYGDGSCAYSISEFDTCIRHGLAPIAVIGTDGAWAQIAREQTEMLGDDVGTVLLRSDYHKVAEGYGGKGLLLTDPSKIDETLDEAKAIAKEGKPVCLNVHIASTDFRKGSISM